MSYEKTVVNKQGHEYLIYENEDVGLWFFEHKRPPNIYQLSSQKNNWISFIRWCCEMYV